MAGIYLSVCVKRGSSVLIPTSVVKFSASSTFFDLLESVWSDKRPEEVLDSPVVCTVLIAKDSTFAHSCQTVQLHHEVAVCQLFDCKYVSFNLKLTQDSQHSVEVSSRSAADFLMRSAREKVLPAKLSSTKMKSTERLYNDLIDYLASLGPDVGWSRDCVETTGKRFVSILRDALWFMDGQHSKFLERGLVLPVHLSQFDGYNDWKAKKLKQPQLSQDKLTYHINTLSDTLLSPWILRQSFKPVFEDVEKLLDCMNKYRTYLRDVSERMNSVHHSSTPARTPSDNMVLLVHEASEKVAFEYQKLFESLGDDYEPVHLEEFAPEDRFQRRQWLSAIALPVPFVIYSYQHGNYKGTEHFLWPIPRDVNCRCDTTNARVMTQLNEQMDKYATRAMKKAFIDKYSRRVQIPKMVLRNIFRELSDDSSCSESSEQQIIDERVAEFLVTSDDPSLLLDMRTLNGKPGSTKFDAFWDEVDKLVVENASVQEWRHGECLYLPIVMSVEDLRNTVASRLPEGTLIPSNEWIRLQFWPTNPYSKVAVHYTGRFNLKFKVQSRLLRATHEDSHYVAALYKYQKNMAIKLRDHSFFVYVDDKANVPVGEPACPISTGVRGRQKAIVPHEGPSLSALDHDFHIAGITPSVVFLSSIPSSIDETFFSGSVCVTTKDKVLQPSSPMRHAVELQCVILDKLGDTYPPILFMYSDGGPDHRLTFGSVQVSIVCLFLRLNLDMVVAVRCAPHQSWTNLAERCMSLLNLALQNVALQRASMSDDLEKCASDASTLSELRRLASKKLEFRAAYSKSMQSVIDLLNNRFGRMKLKDIPFSTYTGASNDDIIKMFEEIFRIDNTIQMDKLGKKELAKAEDWLSFVSSHCKCSHYSFQIKKCTSVECSICQSHPPRTPDFDQVHFLPDPEPTTDKLHYLPFDQLYSKKTSDKYRPSRLSDSTEKETDKDHRALLIAARVRDFIVCCECSKPRCVFAATRLGYEVEIQLERVKDEGVYTCGASLFPDDHPLRHSVVVREALKCSSLVEASYYSSPRVCFEMCCVHCGNTDNLLDDADHEIQEARRQFQTVRPICTSCKSEGKGLVTRGPTNFKKPRLA